jgi:PTH1 family peptidyl-tRNA hydrolase
LVGEVRREAERVLLVKPQTFMNASGEVAASLRRFYRFAPTSLVAVYDDVDLEPGRVRIRASGGPGGHRGVESLIDAIADRAFPRVRVGVGRPPVGRDTADYVLGVPEADEWSVLSVAEERAAEAVELVLAEGPERAMNRINQKEAPHGGSPL